MKIVWTHFAIQRVGEIAEYIALDNVSAAEKWVDKIFKRVEDLSSFGKSDRKVSETNDQKLREIIFGNYRIIYRIQKETIFILTVRNFKQMLPIEDLI